MKLKINIQIFAIIAVLAICKQIEIYAFLMIFALVHELTHMLVGMILKLKPETLKIEPFGIAIIFESFENTEKNKALIATAGPAINFILAIIFSFINIKERELIVNANLLLGIFNLIPIYPLDGGRILKAIVMQKKEKTVAEDIINKISNILMIIITATSSILILIYKNIGLLIITIYLWSIVIKENNKYMLKKRVQKIISKK